MTQINTENKSSTLSFLPKPIHHLLFNRDYYNYLIFLVLFFETVLGCVIIRKIPYTEIDWRAYMQEVEGVVVEGHYDYKYLKGDTGPLVYPAGFLYIFAILRQLTDEGRNIERAQYIFLGLYLIFIGVIMKIYSKTNLPPYVSLLLIVSRRIHSIFMLRLFNDCFCMLFAYVSIYFLLSRRYLFSTFFLSLALSIKMNILLFFPAYFIVLLHVIGAWKSVSHLLLIVLMQVLFGLPFLLEQPYSYLKGSFDFGRQFFYIWSVNLKILPEELFLSKTTSNTLLILHVLFLIIFLNKMLHGGIFTLVKNTLISAFKFSSSSSSSSSPSSSMFYSHIDSTYVVTLLFVVNFIGIVFARSLHYQFYVWYYHTLPLLLFFTSYPWVLQVLLLLTIEMVWNIFPSNATTSAMLIACHLTILVGLLRNKLPAPPAPDQAQSKQVKKSQ